MKLHAPLLLLYLLVRLAFNEGTGLLQTWLAQRTLFLEIPAGQKSAGQKGRRAIPIRPSPYDASQPGLDAQDDLGTPSVRRSSFFPFRGDLLDK